MQQKLHSKCLKNKKNACYDEYSEWQLVTHKKMHFQYTAVEIIKNTQFPFVFDVAIVIIYVVH